MSFHTLFFIFLFLPFLLVLYFLCPKRMQNTLLLIASLLFYSWGEPRFVFLLILLMIINYILGIYIEKNKQNGKRCLVEAVVVNLFVLIYFKYYGFFLETIFSLLHIYIPYKTLPMPAGISFFTFTILSYLCDIYRNKIKAERNPIHFALYISFFPKLLMGPIMRYEDIKKQMKNHPTHKEDLEKGIQCLMIGLAQKVILANTFAMIWQNIDFQNMSVSYAWLMIFSYTLQIYFDFQGYSQMAIGLGQLFGFSLPQNFHYPYMAKSVTDFWRRWHITLSLWFRDYIYIPLGGNRTTVYKHIRNMMIVWILTGLWHGASWNFVLWGLYYGIILVIEKYITGQYLDKLPKVLQHLFTMIIIMIGWSLFANTDIYRMNHFLISMFHLNGNNLYDASSLFILKNYFIYFFIGILWSTPLFSKLSSLFCQYFKEELWFIKPILTLLCWIMIITFMVSDTYQAFLYFQF